MPHQTAAICFTSARVLRVIIRFIMIFHLLISPTSVVLANPEAKRLYEDLLSTYNRLIRPVGNNSDKLTVKLGLKLSQLIDVVSITFLNQLC